MSISPQLYEDAQRLVAAREACFETREAIRLSHEEIEKKLTIDTYKGHVLMTDYAAASPKRLARVYQVAGAIFKALAQEQRPYIGVTLKHRPDNLSHTREIPQPRLVLGEAPPEFWTIKEGKLHFRISFSEGGFATGLFLDMAMGRRWLHDQAEGKEVLNLFSYTGPFSMAAALGGAERVIEVDTSRKWLDWARNNQQLNEVTTVRQRHEDAVKFLAKQKDESFELIVSDPPSYANPKKGPRFRVEEAYPSMASDFQRVLRPGGLLLACLNHAQTTRQVFRSWLTEGLQFREWLEPDRDFQQADYLKVAVFEKA